jgi:Glutaredoxin-like domain (DUF836)
MGVAPRFTLVTRRDCHLCEVMEAVLRRVLPDHDLDLELRDVDADAALRARFGNIVPVLLRDGLPVAKVRLTEDQALRLVRRRR